VQTLEEAHPKSSRGCQRKNAPTTKETSGMLGKGLCSITGSKFSPLKAFLRNKAAKTATIMGQNMVRHGCRLKNQPSSPFPHYRFNYLIFNHFS